MRFLLGISIVISCIGCDQATKSLATQTLRGTPPQSYLADTLRFEYALNPGGFLSLGSSLSPVVRQWLFVGFNTFFLLAVGFFIVRRWSMSFPLYIAALLILAGGVGNLIDRVTNQGLVTDFIVLGWGPLRTGVFNVADMAVTFGAITAVWFAPESLSEQGLTKKKSTEKPSQKS